MISKYKEYLLILSFTARQILFVALVLYLVFSIFDQVKPKWLDFHYNSNYLVIAIACFGLIYLVADFILTKTKQ